MTEIITFGAKVAEKIVRATKRGLKDTGLEVAASYERAGFRVYEGELTEDLAKPTNGKTGATKAKAKMWKPVKDDDHDPVWMELDDSREFKIVNRSSKLTATSGTYILWVRVGREWRIIWADC